MNERLRVIVFTLVITVVFGTMVSGVNALLKDRIELNKVAAKQTMILRLLSKLPDPNVLPDPIQLGVIFRKEVKVLKATDSKGLAMEYYRPVSGQTTLYVFSFSGQGFWDMIRGFVAIDATGKKIAAIEFTEHNETPGLGGRISELAFKQRFVGKPINKLNTDGKILSFVSEGTAKHEQEIDGITGASGTTGGLDRFLNESLKLFLQILEKGENAQ